MPQAQGGHAAAGSARVAPRCASLLCCRRSLWRFGVGAPSWSPRRSCANRIRRGRIGLARREMEGSTRSHCGRFATRGGLDFKAGKMKRETRDVPAIDLLVLAEVVEQFASKTIVLLGDFVADEFQFGDISRVSREAPVLILRHRETQIVPGGGANAANNLAALGARVLPVSVVGEDYSGDALLNFFRERKIELSGILRIKNWSTPTKTRFLAGWAHTIGQQVLRVDREPATPLPDATREKLSKKLRSLLRKADALAVSDYGFGVASPEMVKGAMAAIAREIPVTLDARYNLNNYSRAGITSAT